MGRQAGRPADRQIHRSQKGIEVERKFNIIPPKQYISTLIIKRNRRTERRKEISINISSN